MLAWAEHAFLQLKDLAADRNNFLHAFFGLAGLDPNDPDDVDVIVSQWIRAPDRGRPAVGVKLRTNAVVPLTGLREARDRAARLSIEVAHVEFSVMQLDFPSPFRRRLGARRPPPTPKKQPRSAKAPPPPPGS